MKQQWEERALVKGSNVDFLRVLCEVLILQGSTSYVRYPASCYVKWSY